jgi:three-Cys-motif partner protein
MPDSCRFGGATKANGNCTLPAPDDGLPVQCVGPWTGEKHEILRRYLAASGGPRRQYLPPHPGGAAFVDIFAGPGRARVRTTGTLEDGSPLLALRQPVGFTRLVLCEIDGENVDALRRRVACAQVPVSITEGDCNERIADVAAEIPEWGLNVALVDPYRLESLVFATIAVLAGFKRMDLVVFFPVGEIKRNLERNRPTYTVLLDRALGTDEWQPIVKRKGDILQLVEVFRRQLQKRFGYTTARARTVPIKNDKNVPLYHLVFASKHSRGDAIWESITKNTALGQKGLF